MNEIYNEQYYHSGCGPIPYEQPEHWVKFFGMIADHIVSDLKPTTVLDAGCAMGYLVAALRDRGVEAYGIDISEYAISMVRDDIKPYCVVGSLTDNLPNELPQHYDLIVTIEVMEHLYAEDGRKAISNLCKLSDAVLFSSTPDDFEERTHVNVQQREYWAELFFLNGFIDDLEYRPTYITEYAACYRKNECTTTNIIKSYERAIDEQDKKIQQLNSRLKDQIVATQRRDEKVVEQLQMIKDRDETIREHIAMVQERDKKIAEQLQMIKDRDEMIREHIAMVRERDKKIVEQLQMIKDRDETIREHIAMVQERDRIIANQN